MKLKIHFVARNGYNTELGITIFSSSVESAFPLAKAAFDLQKVIYTEIGIAEIVIIEE